MATPLALSLSPLLQVKKHERLLAELLEKLKNLHVKSWCECERLCNYILDVYLFIVLLFRSFRKIVDALFILISYFAKTLYNSSLSTSFRCELSA